MKNIMHIKRITILVISLIFLTGFSQTDAPWAAENKEEKSIIAFTFDDGSTKDMPHHKLKEWNQRILDALNKHKISAVFFATGSRLQGDMGRYVLSSWNNAGHKIANHTFTHPCFNNEGTTLANFKHEFQKNDTFIKTYSNYYKSFRYPFLKEGNTIEKRDGFRNFLKENDYKTGHVTIDASDWYINSRLIKRIKENPKSDISGFKEFYIEHLYDRALYYDSLAFKMTGRRICHTLLLHHNLTSALFLDDLIQHFRKNGWKITDADKAFTDEIYKIEPANIPAGESLIWALAMQSGQFKKMLRYPAEDSRYEKTKMDKLGL